MADEPSFWEELKTRRVYRTGIAYLAAAFVLWQAAEILVPNLGLPEVLLRIIIIVSLAGFPVALVLSWVFDVVPSSQAPGDGTARTRTVSRGKAVAIGVATGVATLLGLGIWLGSSVPVGSRGAGSEMGADLVIVPFDARGSESTTLLGEGIVDLLYTALDGVEGMRVVEPRRSFGARSVVSDPLAGDEVIGAEVASATGAGRVITGRIVELPGQVRITADVREADGTPVATHQVDGSADDVLALVDELSLAVLQELIPTVSVQEIDISQLASGSPQAVRTYLAGRRDYRNGRFAEAAEAFGEAVEIDSTFALAWVALADAYGWSGGHGSQAQTDAILTAARFVDRLPTRSARLVRAYELNETGGPAVDSMRAFVRDYPNDATGWYSLGDFQYHGAERSRLTLAELAEPFDRALALDPEYLPALIHPIEIALMDGDQERFDGYYGTYEQFEDQERGFGLLADVMWGDDAAARVAIDSVVSSVIALDVMLTGVLTNRPDRVDLALTSLGNSIPEGFAGVNVRYFRGSLALAAGRLALFEEDVAAIEADPQFLGLGLLLRFVGAAAGLSSMSAAEEALAAQSSTVGRRDIILSILAMRQGKVDEAASLLVGADTIMDEFGARAAAVRAWIALEEGGRAAEFAALRDAAPRVGSATPSSTTHSGCGSLVVSSPIPTPVRRGSNT